MRSYILNLNKVELSDLDDIITSRYFPIRDTTIKGKRFINFKDKVYIQFRYQQVKVLTQQYGKSILVKNNDVLCDTLRLFEDKCGGVLNTSLFTQEYPNSIFFKFVDSTDITNSNTEKIEIDNDTMFLNDVLVILVILYHFCKYVISSII